LKKQGLLPLTFARASDYDLIDQTDRISIVGLRDLAPKMPVKAVVTKSNGDSINIELKHSLTDEQIKWFKAGSALNAARAAA